MNQFCYNSLFGFPEKGLEKMEGDHRIVVDGDLIDFAKAYEDIMQNDVFGQMSCRFVPVESDEKKKKGIKIYDNVFRAYVKGRCYVLPTSEVNDVFFAEAEKGAVVNVTATELAELYIRERLHQTKEKLIPLSMLELHLLLVMGICSKKDGKPFGKDGKWLNGYINVYNAATFPDLVCYITGKDCSVAPFASYTWNEILAVCEGNNNLAVRVFNALREDATHSWTPEGVVAFFTGLGTEDSAGEDDDGDDLIHVEKHYEVSDGLAKALGYEGDLFAMDVADFNRVSSRLGNLHCLVEAIPEIIHDRDFSRFSSMSMNGYWNVLLNLALTNLIEDLRIHAIARNSDTGVVIDVDGKKQEVTGGKNTSKEESSESEAFWDFKTIWLYCRTADFAKAKDREMLRTLWDNMVEDQHIVLKSAEYKLLLVKLWGILNAEETDGHITAGNRPTLIRNRFFGFWDDFAKFMGEHLS